MLHGRLRGPFVRTRGGAGIAGTTYDFTTGSLPAGTTFTRASSASGFGSTGVLTPYATDVPRFVYDPVTLVPLGLLIEGARTNSIRNNTMVGVAAGTPGTTPTNWVVATTANAVTRTVVGSGTEDGIDYIDVRYFGTPSATAAKTILPEPTTQVAALVGQIWTASVYVRLVGGSMTGAGLSLFLVEQDNVGGQLTFGTTGMVPTAAALRSQRSAVIRTLASATTAFVTLQIHVGHTISVPIDITLRIGLPQLEQGGGETSPVRTSTVAVTRAADTANLTDASVLTRQCVVVRARTASATASAGVLQPALEISDGTTANRKMFHRNSANDLIQFAALAGATVVSSTLATLGNAADFAVAARFATDNSAASLNGAAVVSDAVGTMPGGLTLAALGRVTGSVHYWNSTISSIETRTTASDGELQALSS